MLIDQITIPQTFRGVDYSNKQRILAVNKETGYMFVGDLSGGCFMESSHNSSLGELLAPKFIDLEQKVNGV